MSRSAIGGALSWVGLALLAIALCFGPTDNWSWDPSFYYAQLRSPLIDGDLDFRNETRTGSVQISDTVTGLQESIWPIGPSLSWAPFFGVGHLLAFATPGIPRDGLSAPYIALVSLGSAAYGLLGLALCYQIGRHFGDHRRALLAAALCLSATPLFFYLFRQPIMAHTGGLCAVAALLLIYLDLRRQPALRRDSGLLLGVALGLCFLMRWNGALLAIIPASYLGEHMVAALRRRSARAAGGVLLQGLILCASFGLVISPQLALWQRLYADLLRVPQGPSFFTGTLLPVNLPQIFLSTNRGVVFWLPLALIGMVGLLRIPDRVVRWTLIASVAAQLWLLGYRNDWYGGGGFGSRYMVDLLPILCAGFVCLAQGLRGRRGWAVAAAALGALSLHQLALVYAVEQGIERWAPPGYGAGQPLGVAWQARVLLDLLSDPLAWFSARPFVGADRQSIATGLLSGAGVPAIAGVAALATPAIVALGLWLWRAARRAPPWLLGGGAMAYTLGWAIYLLLV